MPAYTMTYDPDDRLIFFKAEPYGAAVATPDGMGDITAEGQF